MDKIVNVFKTGWEYFLDVVDIVAGLIERFPKITLALIVLYLIVRR